MTKAQTVIYMCHNIFLYYIFSTGFRTTNFVIMIVRKHLAERSTILLYFLRDRSKFQGINLIVVVDKNDIL